MKEALLAEVPSTPASTAAPSPGRAHVVELVEYRGLLPSQPAKFLGRLEAHERRDVYALLGTFKETRGLVGAAQLLHAYLKEGPLAAARGRITFREFLRDKQEILQLIFHLRQRINRAAEDVCLILPRISRPVREELAHDRIQNCRVS